ncbi:MAG: hypothetical protein ACKO3P_19310 [Planctomycetaceae bacterium]
MFSLLSALLRPLVRLTVGLIAIPLFRLFARRVLRWDRLDAELTKDIEQWVRGALLLLLATANCEFLLIESIRTRAPDLAPAHSPSAETLMDVSEGERPAQPPQSQPGGGTSGGTAPGSSTALPLVGTRETPNAPRGGWAWLSLGLRLMLAIGVIEAMPDQALFSIIHPGPRRLLFPKGRRLQAAREQFWPLCRDLLYRHLDRSSAVFAILSVMVGGRTNVMVGWLCYGIAVLQFLMIGLIASRDKAIDVLTEFDRAIARRREKLERDLRQFD